MGWLFACFGYTKKRKRPKKASKFGPKSRRIRSYQLLESDDPKELDESLPLTCPSLDSGDKPKDENKPTIRKRVRFNLEVTTYELLPADDDATTNSLEFDGVKKSWEERLEDEDEQPTTKVFLGYVPLSKPIYTSNHRYNNCYDEEDEYHDGDDDDSDIEEELSDLDDEDDDDDEDEYKSCLIDADKISHEEMQEHHDIISLPLRSLEGGLETGDGSKLTTRFRSHYVVPVLNPIENLSQWKSIKARKC